MYKILVINPGSTSTKTAIYEDDHELAKKTLDHDTNEIERYHSIWDQLYMRLGAVVDFLAENGVKAHELSCVMCRGGMLPPVKPGAFVVDETLLEIQREKPSGIHSSNLASAIGYKIGAPLNIPVFIYDPVSVDEFEPEARITGIKGVLRRSFGHALNMRAVAKKTAASIGGNYDDFNFVVAHLGGGFTISAHRKGKMIDNLSDDEGAFSPERCGVLGGHSSVMICESMGVDTYRKLLRGKGGLVSHFGDSDLRHLEQLIDEGDEYAALIFDAMAYQIAKFVGALATVLGGQVDQIIFTGGLAYSTRLLDKISDRVKFIAPITVYPGENEMEALAMGGLRVLKGEETARMWNESSL